MWRGVMKSSLFIAWKVCSGRTRVLARSLGVKLLLARSRLYYLDSALETLLALAREKPRIVLAQLPQGPLLALLAIVKKAARYRLVADVHTSFVVYTDPRGLLLNRPFAGMLRYADVVLAHNEDEAVILHRYARPVVAYDPLEEPSSAKPGRHILLPAGFSSDEPLTAMIEGYMKKSAVREPPVITGDWRRMPELRERYRRAPRVLFTGYLPESGYRHLLSSSKLVFTGTVREYTVLRSVFDAASYGKPVVVSRTRTLERLLGGDAIYYDPEDPDDIAAKLREAVSMSSEELSALGERLRRRLVSLSRRSMIIVLRDHGGFKIADNACISEIIT